MKKWIAKTRNGDMLSTGHHRMYGLSRASGILWDSEKAAWEGVWTAQQDDDRIRGLSWDVYEVENKDGAVFKSASSDREHLSTVISNRLNDQAAAINALTARVFALESSRPAPAHGWRLLEEGETVQVGDFYLDAGQWKEIKEGGNHVLWPYQYRRRF